MEIVFGVGFLVRTDEIPDLHEKIPRKFVIGIGSLFGNIGRDFTLYGVILISESEDTIYVAAQSIPGEIFGMRWREAIEIFICDSQKTVLKNMLDKGVVDRAFLKELFEKMIEPQLNAHDPRARDLLQMFIKSSCP
ncbi:MAG: hypothetical protein H8E41_07290 [Desulfobulbaceae bacterium]|uniref:Uncharacterized protein n=1 Tax=Candidatus Desulfobia pelagia TaxID=2841692 RepID=A0A8J6NDY2_9BACT|nr:hypothetical protein [Candidatus Desulfobia pelagia]